MKYKPGNHWTLEQDIEGESYVMPEVSEETIKTAVKTCFAMMGDDCDNSIVSMGNNEKRLVEIGISRDLKYENYVLAKSVTMTNEVELFVDGYCFHVFESELLSVEDATSAFIQFYKNISVPEHFLLLKKSYYWVKN